MFLDYQRTVPPRKKEEIEHRLNTRERERRITRRERKRESHTDNNKKKRERNQENGVQDHYWH